jgi:hypothetical protein
LSHKQGSDGRPGELGATAERKSELDDCKIPIEGTLWLTWTGRLCA